MLFEVMLFEMWAERISCAHHIGLDGLDGQACSTAPVLLSS